MKKMRFLVAILALAIVVVGSSFKTSKPLAQKLLYIVSQAPVSGQSDFIAYTVVQFDELSQAEKNTVACNSDMDETCRFELELSGARFHIDGTPESSDYIDYNAIRTFDGGSGEPKVYHVRVVDGEETWQVDPRIDLLDFNVFSYTPDQP